MPRTSGSFGRRARSIFIAATLVTSGVLAFSPAVPTATAGNDPTEPTASADPTPGVTTPPDPTPIPTAVPTAEPVAGPTPEPTPVTPDPTPAPTTPPDARPTPSPEPPATPDPSPGTAPTAPAQTPTPTATGIVPVSPTPSGGGVPVPDPVPSAEPGAPTAAPGPHAVRFDATGSGAAVATSGDGARLRTFTIETWFVREGPGEPIAAVPTVNNDPPPPTSAGALLRTIPLAARGTLDPASVSSPPSPDDRIAWLLGIDEADGVLAAAFHDTEGAVHRIAGTTLLTGDAWHHAAATFDGEVFRLFLDGRLEAAVSVAGFEPDPYGRSPIALATSVAADGLTVRGAFDGLLDETRLWSSARTAVEIGKDMGDPIDPDAVGLVAGWPMDEGTGSVVDGGSDTGARLLIRGTATWLDSPVPDATAPPAPGSLMAVPAGDAITLGWTAVRADDLAGYRIRRTTDAAADPAAVPLGGWIPIQATAFLDESAVVGVTYRYWVAAVDRYGNESNPSRVATATLTVPPEAPMPVAVRFGLSATGPSPGRRIDPGAAAVVHLTLTPAADLASATLGLSIPAGWTVTDADGATVAADGSALTWPVADLVANQTRVVDVAAKAPLSSPIDGGPSVASTFSAWLEQPGGLSTGPDITVLVTPGVVVSHVIIGRPGDGSTSATYAAQDEPAAGIGRFSVVRIRFRAENHGDVALALTPTLEVRDLSGGSPTGFTAVPARVTTRFPFSTSREWVPVRDLADGSGLPGKDPGGSVLGDVGTTIAIGELRSTGDAATALVAVAGVTATGRNPADVLDLPPGSFSEVEFSVRATADAAYDATYAFRLSDGKVALAGSSIATIALGSAPPLLLSEGQRNGQPVGGPTGAQAGAPSSEGDAIAYRLTPVAAATAEPRYALLAVARSASGATGAPDADPGNPDAVDPAGVHGASAGASGTCAVCHDTHAAGGRNLLTRSGPQAALCFTCHDSAGTGASSRVQAQYEDPAVPPDDPATGSFFRHDALATGTDHTLAKINEFGGRFDRHAECADCHDPHSVTQADSVQTAAGWTVSGRLAGASGIAVANGPAGSAPAYTFVDGASADIGLEYQLCFKCHSGFTTLPPRVADHPSRWAEDKAVELNPENASYHPIEAAGRNGTDTMIASLGGTSPYKLWDFSPDSTIRCINCHGDSRAVLGPTLPAAGSDLAPHAVANVTAADGTELNRGLLILPYRDRVLKGSSDAYDPQDSALCLSCHGQAAFADTSGNVRSDTAFRYHGLHVAGLAGKGAIVGDIDTPNAGLGNALCSECHYRIHSTASRNDFRTTTPQTGTDDGLVLFAPNVTTDDPSGSPLGGTIDWTRTGSSAGTCALTCHGQDHPATPY